MCQPLLSQSVPDELVYDILTRLTVKSLIRFSSVCKSWNSTITSLNFIKAHLDRAKSLSNNNNNNGYLLYKSQVENHSLFAMVYNSNRTLTPIARFQNPFPEGWIVGFCNGLFCMPNKYNHVLQYICGTQALESSKGFYLVTSLILFIQKLLDLRIIIKTMTTRF